MVFFLIIKDNVKGKMMSLKQFIVKFLDLSPKNRTLVTEEEYKSKVELHIQEKREQEKLFEEKNKRNKVSCPKCGKLVSLSINDNTLVNAGINTVLAVINPLTIFIPESKMKTRIPIECPNCGNRWLP